jgi:hypothetical protein
MKIKKPSLKGMKHTKYLGHFAQDKYIEKGHNLSGVLPMTREVQMAAGTASNPFDLAVEQERRRDIALAGTIRGMRGKSSQETAGKIERGEMELSDVGMKASEERYLQRAAERNLNNKKFIEQI